MTIPAGLADTTGGVLVEAYAFGFSTADPTVVRWQPENSVNVRIERPISVTFSMPMDRASTEAAFSLLDGAGQPLAGTFNWSKDGTELGFKPAQLLKFGAKYEAGVDLTARAASGQGTLRDNRRQQFPFLTVPLPSVKRTDPTQGFKNVDPQGGVRFEFAGPMAPGSFGKDAVTVLPKPTQVYTYYNESENYLYLDFNRLPDTDYSVTLAGKVADPYGNTLGDDYALRFHTRGYDPILQLNNQTLVGTYNAYTGTQAVVLYRNLPEVRFDLFSVTPDEFLTLTGGEFWQKWENFQPKSENRIREWSRAGTAARNRVGYMREPLLTADEEQLPAGVYYLEIDGDLPRGQRPPRQLLVRADLNVTLKASTDEALAWVTDLKSGQPVSGAQVRFADNRDNDLSGRDRRRRHRQGQAHRPAAHLGTARRLRLHRGGRVRRGVHQLAGRHLAVGLRHAGRVGSRIPTSVMSTLTAPSTGPTRRSTGRRSSAATTMRSSPCRRPASRSP